MNEIDLGDNHFLKFVSWNPDRKLNPQYKDIPNVDKIGASIRHFNSKGKKCIVYIYFDSEILLRIYPGCNKWTVECWEPLTCSPSLLCVCGDHGFIRNGKWVKA